MRKCTGCRALTDTHVLDKNEGQCTVCSTGHTAQSQKAITSFFESSPHPAPDPQPESSCEPKVKRLRPQEHSDPSDHHGTPTAQKQASIPCTPEELQTVLAFDLNPRFGPTQGRSREERAARAEQLETSGKIIGKDDDDNNRMDVCLHMCIYIYIYIYIYV